MKNLKKVLCVLLVVLMCLTSAPLSGFVGLEMSKFNVGDWFSNKASADAGEEYGYYQGFSYIVKEDNTLSVYHYKGEVEDNELVVPSKMWGKIVTEVRFSSALDKSIKRIVLPDTVTDISIVEPNVDSVNIPGSVKRINGFRINVKEIQIPEGVVEIGSGAFSGFIDLEKIELPESLSTIGSYAFSGCEKLESIKLGNIKSIGSWAFYGCKGLKAIIIPSSCTFIDSFAFLNCEGLEKATFLGDVDLISEYAFAECLRLAVVNFKGSVNNIGTAAFMGCFALSEVMIPSKTEKIGEYAFASCLALKTIEIYSKTVKIAKTAFDKDTYTVDVNKYCETYAKIFELGEEVAEITREHFGDKYTSTPVEEISKYEEKLLKEKGIDKLYGDLNKAAVKDKESKLLIRCYKGSTAEKYAKENGVKYKYFSNNPDEVTGFKASGVSTSAVALKWSKVSDATGYVIYQYNSSQKKYVKIGSTKDTSYKVSKLKSGTIYKFRIKAYKKVNGKNYYSEYTNLSVSTKPGTPKLKVSAGTGKATLTWNKQTGATGYVVYMSTSKNGSYSKIATVKGNTKVTYTKKGLKAGKGYYFKVRAYKTVGKTNVYSSYSNIKGVKIK